MADMLENAAVPTDVSTSAAAVDAIAYDIVRDTRRGHRPVATDYITHMIEGFHELHGDRRFGDDPSVVAGVGRLCGRPVTVIGIEKGKDVKDKIHRNFGSAHPEGYRKALRLMKQAEKFRRPVLCLVDTAGAFCGMDAEERGQGQAIAENLAEMMTLRTPVLSLIIGEGGSGGAIGLSVANEVWMMEGAYYSVISPESCANILWKDASRAGEVATSLKLTAADLLELAVVERAIPEPDTLPLDLSVVPAPFMSELARVVAEKLDELSAKDDDTLLRERYEKFRKIGRVGL